MNDLNQINNVYRLQFSYNASYSKWVASIHTIYMINCLFHE